MRGGSGIDMRWRGGFIGSLTAAAIALCAGCSQNPSGPDDGGPTTILVDAAGGGDYVTIEAGINASSEGDTVLVAPGTYFGDGNRDLDFGGINITLRAASARDSTVIDCGAEGRAFLFENGEDESSVIDGFIIKKGRAAKGGAIRCDGAAPTIRNITFRSNHAISDTPVPYGDGGAIYLEDSSPALVDVTFVGNMATEGSGGAIFCLDSSPSIENITCVGNEAGSGGAIACIFSSPAILNASFIGNHASAAGGAIYCGGSDERRADPSITGAVLIANSAWRGAGMSLNDASPSIRNVTFARNDAVLGGGIYCENGCEPSITRTIIAFSNGGAAIECGGGDDPATTRSCVFGNSGGDELCGTYSDILSADPLFCDMNMDDVSLCENSPCLSGNNSWGVLIGGRSVGCDECGESRR